MLKTFWSKILVVGMNKWEDRDIDIRNNPSEIRNTCQLNAKRLDTGLLLNVP